MTESVNSYIKLNGYDYESVNNYTILQLYNTTRL